MRNVITSNAYKIRVFVGESRLKIFLNKRFIKKYKLAYRED